MPTISIRPQWRLHLHSPTETKVYAILYGYLVSHLLHSCGLGFFNVSKRLPQSSASLYVTLTLLASALVSALAFPTTDCDISQGFCDRTRPLTYRHLSQNLRFLPDVHSTIRARCERRLSLRRACRLPASSMASQSLWWKILVQYLMVGEWWACQIRANGCGSASL